MPVQGVGMGNFDTPDTALEPARTLWSYDTVLELRFREHLHPVTVFVFGRTQDTFYLDFSLKVEEILQVLFQQS